MAALHEVEKLLDQIRVASHNPVVEKATDDLATICRAYMDNTGAERPWANFNLTKTEEGIFALLLRRRGQVLSKAQLHEATCFSGSCDHLTEAVDVHICRIRRKIRSTPYEGTIETVWARGYRMKAS